MEGYTLPQNEPITVHFTFQFGDTGDYPHGKRQRAREAALWAVDPPAYFTDGVYVALLGETYDPAYKAKVYDRFPEWSPQRHMFLDAPQRQAVRAGRCYRYYRYHRRARRSLLDRPARSPPLLSPPFPTHQLLPPII